MGKGKGKRKGEGKGKERALHPGHRGLGVEKKRGRDAEMKYCRCGHGWQERYKGLGESAKVMIVGGNCERREKGGEGTRERR